MATELQLLLIKFTQLDHEVSFEMASEVGKINQGQTGYIVMDEPVVKAKNPNRVLGGQVGAVKRALKKAEIEELARQAAEIMAEESEYEDESESESESEYESASSDSDE
jgi:hypothetical protein